MHSASPVRASVDRGSQARLVPARDVRRCRHVCISLLTMKTSEKWARNIKALEIYVAEHGHARVPAAAQVEVDGVPVSIGSWVSYLRVKNKLGSITPEKKEVLERFPSWSWGPCKPGPLGDAERDAQMLQARATGRSLQSIADEYGLSRQRVHQILERINKKEKQVA